MVEMDGRRVYVGAYGTPEAEARYHELLSRWATNGRRAPVDPASITVVELIDRYLPHVAATYRKHGTPTSEAACIPSALKYLGPWHRERAVAFGPARLKAARAAMIAAGLARTTTNSYVARVIAMFRWAAHEEILPAAVRESLKSVPGLRRGRSAARETAPVKPVPRADVDATLPHLPRIVADAVRLQLATGARPGEILILRPGDVDRTSSPWAYAPSSFKTEHREHDRTIFMGPEAQRILAPYLLRAPDAYCFDPRESEADRLRKRREARVTPPSCGNTPGSNRVDDPAREPGDRYTVASYRRCIERACKLAKVATWTPHRLRHLRATEIRKQYGLDATAALLGHREVGTSMVYAELDRSAAAKVAQEVG